LSSNVNAQQMQNLRALVQNQKANQNPSGSGAVVNATGGDQRANEEARKTNAASGINARN